MNSNPNPNSNSNLNSNMNKYKNVLIGMRTFFPDWYNTIKKISKPNIFISDFRSSELKKYIENNNIHIIVPLSFDDYYAVKKINISDQISILHPDESTFNLLNNKVEFTKWMCNEFPNLIPPVYFLNGEKKEDVQFPLISKPEFSTNGKHMKIYYDSKSFQFSSNRLLVQKFIDINCEYGGFFLCENGKILTHHIIKNSYQKFNIKKRNFPMTSIVVNNFSLIWFEKIIEKLNYSGGINFDFKYDDANDQIYIFEINPRFGGSAFSNNFIYSLLCVE